ncbi:DNA helicase-2/ATP-dependent DNA helicase PcrA [Clostridium algifaecis]|uniref:DNA helicase-2/ATP-dependent DNA helicase PcrA n=1 Tax=Clostridium algifaecis TaxID=1472040 RepID=A0ABS4KRH1_9CLOT|nr:UvrD-helicase domain-containing protein [Clostridium algifaecis]MBP2032632.1 DNA helicase-2/ATP-dependent DNA helicase PcrA [Clostridium algifaecis]
MKNSELENELKKEIEINNEKDKLSEVIKEINDQILMFISARKKVANFILNYREKSLEEYKYDEDKKIEYFNHELFIKEEQYKVIDKKLREFNILKDYPYFGKVDFEDKYGKENIYVGRFGITDMNECTPIVVDWRSPVSSLFYQDKLGEAKYNAPEGEEDVNIISKRQFIIKKGKLTGMFDSILNVKDQILQYVLSKNANEKLKNIVMTIQKEQDDLIRQPRKGVVVIDGVAGSGKTTIALHRVAYLLYNYRSELQNKVLIFGPNSIFMDYISTILPSLGEEGVEQTTFRKFASQIIEIDGIMDFKRYMENVLQNNCEFTKKIKYKRSMEYINAIDSLIDNLKKNYFKVSDVKFYNKVLVEKSEIEDMFNVYFKKMPLFKRSSRIIRIIYSKIKEERNIRVRKIQEGYNYLIKSMTEEELNINAANLEFKEKNEIRKVVEESLKIKNEQLNRLKNPDVIDIYNDFNGNQELIYEDLAPILYMKIELEGLKYKEHLRHIVIDEAQDYSPLEFIVIRRLTNCKSFTIVGDVSQSILPFKEQTAMINLENLFDDVDVKKFLLKTSYRSTNEIMKYADKYVSSNKLSVGVRNGEKVDEFKIDNLPELAEKIVKNIMELRDEGYESIAVICRSLKETEALSKLIQQKIHINVFDREYMIYSKGEIIIPSYFAKGLEFDAVIMIDNFSNDSEDKLKYIMCTRALHKLCVYKAHGVF